MKDAKDRIRNFNRLTMAIKEGNVDRFNHYIHDCALEDFKYINEKGENLLFYTLPHPFDVKNKMVPELLKKGMNINQRDKKNNTLLLKLAQTEPIDFDSIKLLLENGANINAKNKEAENIVLSIFCKYNNCRRHSEKLLIFLNPTYELDVKATNKQGETLLDYLFQNQPKNLMTILKEIVENHRVNFLPEKSATIFEYIIKSKSSDLFQLFKNTDMWSQSNIEYFFKTTNTNKMAHYEGFKELEKEKLSLSLLDSNVNIPSRKLKL